LLRGSQSLTSQWAKNEGRKTTNLCPTSPNTKGKRGDNAVAKTGEKQKKGTSFGAFPKEVAKKMKKVRSCKWKAGVGVRARASMGTVSSSQGKKQASTGDLVYTKSGRVTGGRKVISHTGKRKSWKNGNSVGKAAGNWDRGNQKKRGG